MSSSPGTMTRRNCDAIFVAGASGVYLTGGLAPHARPACQNRHFGRRATMMS
jgi:glucokinase